MNNEELNNKNEHNLYIKNTLEIKLLLEPIQIGDGITINCIQNTLKNHIEGRCNSAGYIQPNSIKIISHSAGLLKYNAIEFNVIFECRSCNPVIGTIYYNCKCIESSKAGIKALLFDNKGNQPVIVLINRELVNNGDSLTHIKVGDLFHTKVIGSHFELNDNYVVVIGSLYHIHNY